jgi:Photosystem II complex subunit Ycf12
LSHQSGLDLVINLVINLVLVGGGLMGFILDIFNSIDFILIAQLVVLAMVVIAGPAIVFLLFLRGGDL